MPTAAEQRLLDAIDPDEVAALTAALVAARSPNPPGEESAAAAVLADACRERGLDVRVEEAAPGRPNVLASVGPAGPGGLVLLGHTDVVPPGEGWTRDPYGGAIEAGRVYGRGATDMKGGLAAAVVAMAALARSGASLSGPVTLAAVVDEEESGLGVRTLLAGERVQAAGAIVAEPTELQTIIACRGNCYVDVEVRGRSAHSGSPEAGRNAIYGATRVIDGVRRLHAALQEETHPLLGAGAWSVGIVRGGTGTAMVPDRCRISIDRRLIPGQTGDGAREEVAALLADLDLGADDLAASVELLMEIPSFEVAPDHPLVGAVVAATADAGGPSRPVAGWSASCDGGYVMRDTGIPTVVLGPGSVVEQAHRPDESVSVAEVTTAARTYALAALRLLSS